MLLSTNLDTDVEVDTLDEIELETEVDTLDVKKIQIKSNLSCNITLTIMDITNFPMQAKSKFQ